jgi:hypothetical protein
MPVVGSYDASKLVIGPGKMYLGAPLPADGASISTILTGGVPASGTLVGYTKTGTEYHSSVDQEGYEVDETKSPIFTNVTAENVSITGTLVQLVDAAVLKALLPNYRFLTPATFSVGGLVSYAAEAQPSVLVVGQDRAVPTKIVAVMLYKAQNIGEFILAITRANPSETDFEFQGQAIGSRMAGDQVGQVWFESIV